MSRVGPSPVESVTVIIDGVTHHGSYFLRGSVVHVRSPLGARATQVGGSPPEAIAMLLLSELVREPKRLGQTNLWIHQWPIETTFHRPLRPSLARRSSSIALSSIPDPH
jgi:hypothetical protein